MALELLGPSLAAVRRVLPNKAFSLSAALRLGSQMLQAIQDLFNAGYVHRDIKPANFLIRPRTRSRPIALIDFGLARRYLNDEGTVVPPRQHVGFVGTAKYTSVNAHEKKDLGMRDDLIAWFYSLLELMKGSLPWPSSKDRNIVYEAKKNANMRDFCKDLPGEIIQIYETLEKMSFDEKPNITVLQTYFLQAIDHKGVRWNDPFDWEGIEPEVAKRLTSMDLTVPSDLTEDVWQPDVIAMANGGPTAEGSSTGGKGGCCAVC
jgi:serine/threonine protein kinase